MKASETELIHQSLLQAGLLPLYNDDDPRNSVHVIQAAYRGGSRLFEFTNRSTTALEVFREISPEIHATCPGIILGAGSIRNVDEAIAFHELGAAFLVSPALQEPVISYAIQHSCYVIPGAATLTEVLRAQQLGARLVKLFPAHLLGGPSFVSAIKAPCPDLLLMASGGVENTESNLKEWFRAGVACVGMGSGLFRREMIAAKDWVGIEQATRSAIANIQKVKNG